MLPLTEFFLGRSRKSALSYRVDLRVVCNFGRVGLACLHPTLHQRIDRPRITSACRDNCPESSRASIYNDSTTDAIFMEAMRCLHGTCFCLIFFCICQITSLGPSSDW